MKETSRSMRQERVNRWANCVLGWWLWLWIVIIFLINQSKAFRYFMEAWSTVIVNGLYSFVSKTFYKYALLWWKQVRFLQCTPRRSTWRLHYGCHFRNTGNDQSHSLVTLRPEKQRQVLTVRHTGWAIQPFPIGPVKRKISCLFLGSIHDSPTIQPAAYINWATLAMFLNT